MRRLFLFLLIGSFGFSSAWAQDSADSLFTNPEPDSKAVTNQKVSTDAFTGKSLNFFETLAVEGYYVSGYTDAGEQLNSPVNALNFGFGTDMRLDRTARAYASLYLAYPAQSTPTTNLYNPYQPTISLSNVTSVSFDQIKVKELFLDYSLGDVAIFRLGRQTATWGQGKIFNPNNLVEGIENGMAAKLSTAVGPVNVNVVAIKNDSEYSVSSGTPLALSLASLGEAAQAEYSAESYSVGVSGFYNASVGEKAGAYWKTSLWSSDLFVEALGEWGSRGAQSFTGVTGVYHEFGEDSKWLKLEAEWLISGRGSTGSFAVVSSENLGFNDQSIGIAATTDVLNFVSLKPSVAWLQTLVDNSGQLIVGFVSSALPHIDLTLGLTRVYGSPTSRYIVNNPDSLKRTWSVTIKAAFNFDIKSVDDRS